ncbi:MAG: hypothetical protein ACRENE_03720 [Polyangiaceae bacterium]
MERFLRSARNASLVASGAIALVGFVAGAVRLLPWLLDPRVPINVALPFARGLVAVALEAALFVGWPVGCAIACFEFVERGEARVAQSLGERPLTTVARLLPQGLALAALLGGVALVYGSDANAPGRVATELVESAHRSCTRASAPTTYSIPFTDLTWLCAPDRAPRLVGSPSGALASAVVSARDARIAGDFRSVELDDARMLLGDPAATIHVGALGLSRMTPWARASTLPAPLRAVLFSLTAWLAASLSAFAVMLRAARTRIAAIVVGASGPLAALGSLRWLEQGSAGRGAFVLVPVACALACVGVGAVLPRLRLPWAAASTSIGAR